MRALLSVVVILSAATASYAADRKVGPHGPYESIQEAVDAASPGDRILIGPGTYNERVVVPDGMRGLQFIGRKVVWDGNDGADQGTCLTILDDDVVVKGITFRNGARHIVAWADDVHVSKCVFRNSGDFAVWMEGDGARVESCRFVGASAAVDIAGPDAVVRRNDVRNSYDSPVRVIGDDALVERNSFRTTAHGWNAFVVGRRPHVVSNVGMDTELGFYVVGDDARVTGNRVWQVRATAFNVEGDHAVVESNRALGFGDTAIRVIGNRFSIARNTVSDAVGDVDGIAAISASESGGGTIDHNLVGDVAGFGFFVYGAAIDVRQNVATRCGALDGGGFRVFGVSIEIESNLSADCDDTAFAVEGRSIVLRYNMARDATGDGFQIAGDDHSLERNTALRCGGEGLHNAGVATDVSGCRFSGNRIDVACAQGAGASFSDFSGNTFATGGEDVEPEVDFPVSLKSAGPE